MGGSGTGVGAAGCSRPTPYPAAGQHAGRATSLDSFLNSVGANAMHVPNHFALVTGTPTCPEEYLTNFGLV